LFFILFIYFRMLRVSGVYLLLFLWLIICFIFIFVKKSNLVTPRQ
jgi:hypothetical protein